VQSALRVAFVRGLDLWKWVYAGRRLREEDINEGSGEKLNTIIINK